MAITKIPAAGFTGNNFRNIIINGDMSIAQRGTSQASITTNGYYTIDRYQVAINSLGTWTQSQSTDIPTGQGFANSLKMDCTTANASPSASHVLLIQHRIEGQNLQYIKKGTANAQSLTASFWVKSNKTGTYIVELFDRDNTRTISKSYTINTANTWEKKTIIYEGDTTGTIVNDNSTSIDIQFWLGAGTDFTSGTLQTSWGSQVTANRAVGQVNLADNTANEWYITGVQLEAGTTASDFEFLPVDVNFSRCARYYFETKISFAGYAGSSGLTAGNTFPVVHPTPMRTTPSVTGTVSASANYSAFNVRQASEIASSVNLQASSAGRVFADFSSMEFNAEL